MLNVVVLQDTILRIVVDQKQTIKPISYYFNKYSLVCWMLM